ncbi:hypothetical protein BO94DRAFT_598392 [Aspergillus sclerotioniger CBS 115572]|uniref:Uncharacterized protein n=1 Tax=Aspergillus sclerotioniger CBS 115572 TaxID=1450535 RepID=A0A317WDP2_9EURO|nr:hypothetical protein BO94DRAFT_598392 [Aspergillus sclerotioniger CBS 115572]PWY84586.1 hypothetical protein BO94DRAFT_598392 [Aspergillus sclerotioniger CBS 115572]
MTNEQKHANQAFILYGIHLDYGAWIGWELGLGIGQWPYLGWVGLGITDVIYMHQRGEKEDSMDARSSAGFGLGGYAGQMAINRSEDFLRRAPYGWTCTWSVLAARYTLGHDTKTGPGQTGTNGKGEGKNMDGGLDFGIIRFSSLSNCVGSLVGCR